MQISKYLFLLSVILLLLASCNSDTPNSSAASAVTADAGAEKTTKATANMDHGAIASELCTCMQPLIDLNKKIQKLVKQGKTTEVQDMIQEVEAASEKGEACTEKLESKYGQISGQDEVQVETAMHEVCPEVARMISNNDRR